MGQHRYKVETRWTGNLGVGTSGYNSYSRNHEISVEGKAAILGSSDPKLRGDPARYNPEELLVAALSACHMLWTLHLCADAGITVMEYRDRAEGEMRENSDGSGEFVSVTLRPEIRISDGSRAEETKALNHRAHELCFIARSVNFPVGCEPSVTMR